MLATKALHMQGVYLKWATSVIHRKVLEIREKERESTLKRIT